MPIAGREPSEHLCYEIRGTSDEYFNFISDECVSVNAHYDVRDSPQEDRPLHVVNEIAIRAVDNAGACVNILIDRNGCTASVDGAIVPGYSRNGIILTPAGLKYQVSVPNCNETDLEMEVVCEENNNLTMLRFEVTRGANLREASHGLIGETNPCMYVFMQSTVYDTYSDTLCTSLIPRPFPLLRVLGTRATRVQGKNVSHVPSARKNRKGLAMRLLYTVTFVRNIHDIMYNFLFPTAQFWNVDVSIEKFTGTLRENAPTDNVYIITVTPLEGEQRRFPAWQEVKVG